MSQIYHATNLMGEKRGIDHYANVSVPLYHATNLS